MIHPDKQRIIDIYGKDPESLDELFEAIIQVINAHDCRSYFRKGDFKVAGLAWNIMLHEKVSNSHERPLNGVTNFNRDIDKPLGYQGYSGRVWIRYKNNPPTFGSEPFADTLTYPGTGGGGDYGGVWSPASTKYFRLFGNKKSKEFNQPHVYSWDYRFFLDDFPKLYDFIYKDKNWHILQGKQWTGNHIKQWTDPEILEHDKKLMEYPEEFLYNKEIA